MPFKFLKYGLKAKRVWDLYSSSRDALHHTVKVAEHVQAAKEATEPGVMERVLDYIDEEEGL